jgi:hypothetical protein
MLVTLPFPLYDPTLVRGSSVDCLWQVVNSGHGRIRKAGGPRMAIVAKQFRMTVEELRRLL